MCSPAKALRHLMFISGLLLVLLISTKSFGQALHQNLNIQISSGLQMLNAEVTITVPAGFARKTTFLLNKNLNILSTSLGDSVTLLQAGSSQDTFSQWGLQLGTEDNKITVRYSGVINDPIKNDDTTGFISHDGAVLMGSTYWYPTFLDQTYVFDLKASVPSPWKVVNQGQLSSIQNLPTFSIHTYKETQPQEDIYLISGPFFEYLVEDNRGLQFKVLLRSENKGLAQSYLSLIPDYIQHYSKTIGAYPYRHFTVVENFWETGYGMPAFTLLGPSVIRLPFILNSSLPHEILHNWWGNSVYIDYNKGNWAEGLTTYLADHWQQELTKTDADYRLSQLMAYSDYVKQDNDFALIDFKGRHNSASQAVGYGKTMMFFHMLKNLVGPTKFEEGIKKFYNKNAFKKASYADIQVAFEEVTGKDLKPFFQQWTERVGAPKIELRSVNTYRWFDGGYAITFALKQSQAGTVYDLEIPVVWTLENDTKIRQTIRLQTIQQTYTFFHSQKPKLLEIDPQFDLFRQIYTEERPSSLSQIYSAPEVHVFFHEDQQKLLSIPNLWHNNFKNKFNYNKVVDDLNLPSTGHVLLLGSFKLFEDLMKNNLKDPQFEVSADMLKFLGYEYPRNGHSFVISTRSRINPEQTITWILADDKMDLSRWATRLTHYGKFGVLTFEGDRNVLKTVYPSRQSPLKMTPSVLWDGNESL